MFKTARAKAWALFDAALWKLGYSNDKQLVDENDKLKADFESLSAEYYGALDKIDYLLNSFKAYDEKMFSDQENMLAVVGGLAFLNGGSIAVPIEVYQAIKSGNSSIKFEKGQDKEIVVSLVENENGEQAEE